jgi:RNA polymerase sigma factor (sigma-70 family)
VFFHYCRNLSDWKSLPGKGELSAEDGEYILSIVDLFKRKAKSADRFERLVGPSIDTLYRLAFRLCNSRDDAEELVQLFLTRIFPKIDLLETIEKLTPWLCRSLYNLYVDGYRQIARESLIISKDDFNEEIAGHEQTPFEHTSNNELSTTINTALQQLNNDQRIIVLLHDSEGYTLEELTDILQVPLGTVKSRLNRARSSLRKSLKKEPFEDSKRVIGIER